MLKMDGFRRVMLTDFFRIGAYARGVLSFDLPVRQAHGPDPSTMLRVMVRYSNHEALEGEALDRWYGVNTSRGQS